MSELSLHNIENIVVHKDVVVGENNPKDAFFVTKIFIQESGRESPFEITLFHERSQDPLPVEIKIVGGPEAGGDDAKG